MCDISNDFEEIIRSSNQSLELAIQTSDSGDFKESLSHYNDAEDGYGRVLSSGSVSLNFTKMLSLLNILVSRQKHSLEHLVGQKIISEGTGAEESEGEDSLNRDFGDDGDHQRTPSSFQSGSEYYKFKDRVVSLHSLCDVSRCSHLESSMAPSNHGEVPTDLEHWEKYFLTLAEQPSEVGFHSLVGHGDLKALLATTIFSDPKSRYKHLVNNCGGRKPNILFHGYSGTGKSLVARAYAAESRISLFIPITAADVLSKYIGESEVKLKALLSVADRSPSIIFIDEVDGLLGGDKDNKCSTNFVNEFLIRIEKTQNVQVLAASNFPWRLPTAVLRRFQYILYVPLPTLSSRVGIIKRILGDTNCNLDEIELTNPGRMCENFSGSDINRAINFAKSLPALLCQRSRHFKIVEQNGVAKYIPCSQSDVSAEPVTFNELPHDRISAPELTHAFLSYAIKCCKPSADLDDKKQDYNKMMAQFRQRFGKILM